MAEHDVVFKTGTNVPGDPLLPAPSPGILPPAPPAGNPAIGQGNLTQFGQQTPQLFQGATNALTRDSTTAQKRGPLAGVDPNAFINFLMQSGLLQNGGTQTPQFSGGGIPPTPDIGGLLSKLFSINGAGAGGKLNPAGQDFLLRLSRGETAFPQLPFPDAPTSGV